jgi:hypothetical protein
LRIDPFGDVVVRDVDVRESAEARLDVQCPRAPVAMQRVRLQPAARDPLLTGEPVPISHLVERDLRRLGLGRCRDVALAFDPAGRPLVSGFLDL